MFYLNNNHHFLSTGELKKQVLHTKNNLSDSPVLINLYEDQFFEQQVDLINNPQCHLMFQIAQTLFSGNVFFSFYFLGNEME